MRATEWQLFGAGGRKYVTETELARFLNASRQLPAEGHAFCTVLAYSGCRISEALALTRAQIGQSDITLRTLKRRKTVYRVVQLPPHVVIMLRELPGANEPTARLWPQHRSTAYRWVKRAMRWAEITGASAMPKGLRHGFGIKAATRNVPPNLIQRWLGHASLSTTALYLDAVSAQERQFAERMW